MLMWRSPMVRKVGFLGKSGIGKSTILSGISAMFAKQGYRVLQIGNDLALNSTSLLRNGKEAISVLEEYREKYHIQVKDYIGQEPLR